MVAHRITKFLVAAACVWGTLPEASAVFAETDGQKQARQQLEKAAKIKRFLQDVDQIPAVGENVSSEQYQAELIKGIAACDEALRFDPHSVDALLYRALFNRFYQSFVDQQAKEVREWEKLGTTAIEPPKDAPRKLERAKARAQKSAAKRDLLKAVELAPRRADASYELSRLADKLFATHGKMEDRDLADKFAERAYQLRVEERRALKTSGMPDAMLGYLAYRTKRWEDVIALNDQLIAAYQAKQTWKVSEFDTEPHADYTLTLRLIEALFRTGRAERGRQELVKHQLTTSEKGRFYESLNPNLTAEELHTLASNRPIFWTEQHDGYDLEIELLSRAIALAPKRSELYMERGQRHLKVASSSQTQDPEGAAAKALSDFDSAEKQGGKLRELHSLRGQAHQLREEYREALASFEKSWDVAMPGDEVPLDSTLAVCSALGLQEKELEFIDRYLQRRGKESVEFKYRERRILLLETLGRDREAMASYKELYTKKKLGKDWRRAERLFLRAGTAGEQIEFYRRWESYDPTALGTAYLTAGRNQEALAEFQRLAIDTPRYAREYGLAQLVATRTDDPLIRMRQAGAWRLLSRPQRARAMYDELIEQFPKSPLVFCQRAMLKIEIGDVDGARRDLEEASRLDADSPYVAAARGAEFQSQGKYAEAVAAYDQALAKNPYLGGAIGRRALARLALQVSRKTTIFSHTVSELCSDPGVALGETTLHFPTQLPIDSSVAHADLQETWDAAFQRLFRGDVQGGTTAIAQINGLTPAAKKTDSEKFNAFTQSTGGVNIWDAMAPSVEVAETYIAWGRARGDYATVIVGPRNQGAKNDVTPSVFFPDELLWKSELNNVLQPLAPIQSRWTEPKLAEDFLLAAWVERAKAEQALKSGRQPQAQQSLEKARKHLDQAIAAPSLGKLDPLTASADWVNREVATLRERLDQVEKMDSAPPGVKIAPGLMAAAKKGDPGAQFDVGMKFYKAKQFVPAKEWLQKAAEQQYGPAQDLLAAVEKELEQSSQQKKR